MRKASDNADARPDLFFVALCALKCGSKRFLRADQ